MEEASQRNDVVLYVVGIIFGVRVSMCVYYNRKVRVFSIIYGIQYDIRIQREYMVYSMILWGSNVER